MTTDAQKRAVKGYTDKLVDRGHRKITIWLSPATVAILAALAPRYGSARAAIEAGLKAVSKPKP